MAKRVGHHLGNYPSYIDVGMYEVVAWPCIPQPDQVDRLAAMVSK